MSVDTSLSPFSRGLLLSGECLLGVHSERFGVGAVAQLEPGSAVGHEHRGHLDPRHGPRGRLGRVPLLYGGVLQVVQQRPRHEPFPRGRHLVGVVLGVVVEPGDVDQEEPGVVVVGAEGEGTAAGAEERERTAARDLVDRLGDGKGEVAGAALEGLLGEVVLEADELMRLEPPVARVAEEGDEHEAVVAATVHLRVVGEGDAVDVAGPPRVGLDLAPDHVAEAEAVHRRVAASGGHDGDGAGAGVRGGGVGHPA